METESMNWAYVKDRLEGLHQELARLSERITALEKTAGTKESQTVAPMASSRSTPVAESLSEEIILVLGAAVAAYLGKRAPIRQIRLLGSAAWAQQGRVTIQASHTR
jgi:methylmalonyl-CoA carboxyltransferase large subunit